MCLFEINLNDLFFAEQQQYYEFRQKNQVQKWFFVTLKMHFHMSHYTVHTVAHEYGQNVCECNCCFQYVERVCECVIW